MIYQSTRGKQRVSLDAALVMGLAEDGGLFLPLELPQFSADDFAEAMTFIQKHVNELIVATFDEANRIKEKTSMAGQTSMAGPNNEYNPMMESARLWGEFMKPYTTMVSNTMDEAMSAAAGSPVSQQMKQAMSTSMAAWGLPIKSDQPQMAETLKSLSEQMENLAAKVEELQTQLSSYQKFEGSEEE